MRKILALAGLSLALTGQAAAQLGSVETDLSGDWRITFRGHTAEMAMEMDSGWILGAYQERDREVSVGIRSQAGRTLSIEIVSAAGETAYCEAQLERGDRRIVGSCDPGGALELVR